MPANLTPEYERAERRYRQAASDQERQAALQEMLSAIPKHKGTEKMQADLARQIHRDLPERMRFARLWGHSRFDGQQVHKTEPLKDRDVVEIHE